MVFYAQRRGTAIVSFQQYIRPQSLEEAWELNQKRNARIIGGMLWLKMSKPGFSFGTAIDPCDLGLDFIEESEEEFSIGAMTSLRQLEKHPGLAAYSCGAVETALKSIVGVQFRNLATVGGSLWRRMGFSDVLTVFMAMDSYVELYKGGIISLEDFASMKYDNDILVRLIVKKTPGAFVYQAVRKQKTDIPSLTCAASNVDGEFRMAIGARPGRAMMLRDENSLLLGGVSEESAAAFADWAAQTVPVRSNTWGSAAWRERLVRTLAKRSLVELGGKL